MGILLDLDGTLLDTAPEFLNVINQLRLEQDLAPLSLKDIRPFVSEGLSAMLKVGFGIDRNHPQFEHQAKLFLNYYREGLGELTVLFEGMSELLLRLEEHQIPWGIVTNKRAELSLPLLEIFNLKNRAACIVSGDTTPTPKPHPAPLLFASRMLGLEASQCIYVGDAMSDIIAGRAAQMRTICALFGYIGDLAEARTWQADHYIEHPNEIWPIIEQYKIS